jgi:hypothetical protein
MFSHNIDVHSYLLYLLEFYPVSLAVLVLQGWVGLHVDWLPGKEGRAMYFGWYYFGRKNGGVREGLTPHLGTPFHADSNELVLVLIALTLTEILVDCGLT